MPSKALLRPAEVLREARRIPGAAEAITGELDPGAVLKRRDEVIHDLDDSSQLPWLEERGITLFRGHGVLAGEQRVNVGDEELAARRAVILDAGSTASMPPIEGLKESGAWTNREATTAKEVPERIVIMGGGVVGSELSQAYQSLGAQVTLVEGERRLLPSEEQFACDQVTTALDELGVDVRTGRRVERVQQEDGHIVVTLDDDSTVSCGQLISALGRTPNTSDLGLDSIGLEPKGFVEVDEHMQVAGHPWLYAIGDVNGRALYTHMGKYQSWIVVNHILGEDTALRHGADGRQSPRVVFTDPQVAAVGHTTVSAEEAGLKVRALQTSTSGNAGGSFYGRDAPGTAQILVDREREVVVGATITGAEVADFLHAATIAVVGEVPMARLRHAIPSFPTRSEIWLKLMEAYEEDE
jgi:dihydrolipoamide dehydrogenase